MIFTNENISGFFLTYLNVDKNPAFAIYLPNLLTCCEVNEFIIPILDCATKNRIYAD